MKKIPPLKIYKSKHIYSIEIFTKLNSLNATFVKIRENTGDIIFAGGVYKEEKIKLKTKDLGDGITLLQIKTRYKVFKILAKPDFIKQCKKLFKMKKKYRVNGGYAHIFN